MQGREVGDARSVKAGGHTEHSRLVKGGQQLPCVPTPPPFRHFTVNRSPGLSPWVLKSQNQMTAARIQPSRLLDFTNVRVVT